MTPDAAVARGRILAASLMPDTGVMRRPTGHATQNANGEEEVTYVDVFTSRCKVSGASTGGGDTTYQTVTIAGVEHDLITAGVRLPFGVPPCQRGYVFEVTAVGPTSDPRLIGRKYLVHNDPAKTDATARRLDVVEL